LKKIIAEPEKNKKPIKTKSSVCVGIKWPTQAPTGAITMDEAMMGSPSFMSSFLSLKFDQVAPSMLKQLTKSPVGRAKLKGTPI